MSFNLKCVKCGEELTEPGGLLFDPPIEGYKTYKYHMCLPCWKLLMEWIFPLITFIAPITSETPILSDEDAAILLHEATKPATPALDSLLEPSAGYGEGPYTECVTHSAHCPFASAQSHEEDQGGYVWNDPAEAHYTCSLLNKTVWGEGPECTQEDWAKKAREELGHDQPTNA